MKNSQAAMLSVAILLAALIIAGGNYMLARSIKDEVVSRATMHADRESSRTDAKAPKASDRPTESTLPESPGRKIQIAMMPKSKGNAYFIACKQGAVDAAKELPVELIWDGPTDPDPAKQNEIIETWITRGVDVIAVAVENRGGISSVLRKRARKESR